MANCKNLDSMLIELLWVVLNEYNYLSLVLDNALINGDLFSSNPSQLHSSHQFIYDPLHFVEWIVFAMTGRMIVSIVTEVDKSSNDFKFITSHCILNMRYWQSKWGSHQHALDVNAISKMVTFNYSDCNPSNDKPHSGVVGDGFIICSVSSSLRRLCFLFEKDRYKKGSHCCFAILVLVWQPIPVRFKLFCHLFLLLHGKHLINQIDAGSMVN